MLSRNEILETLGANREELRRDFGVESMALFGSAARGDAGPLSDVDVLVESPKPISLFELVALQLRLQELLNVPKVDVVLRDSIFPPLRDAILAEALRVPEREWTFRVRHILDAIAKISQYTKGMTHEQFANDDRTVDAVIRNFLVIGEATRHIPDALDGVR
jgi:predicted nucleotidyltransferase